MATPLPSFAPFPEAPWRDHIVPQEWEACLSLWVALAEAHLQLPDDNFTQASTQDESCPTFLVVFMRETAKSGIAILGSSAAASSLLQQCYLLTARLLRLPSTPTSLLQWDFLADFSKLYGKKRASPVLSDAFKKPKNTPEASLLALKKALIINLDNGIKGDLRVPEERLKRLNHIIHVSPHTAELFLAGSDFLDGLTSCYKIMNPPLRKTIITTAYLCLIGLTEAEPPKYSMLTDQLYSLKAAAEAHKAGPTSPNDSMVAELVTVTPILKQVQRRLEGSGAATTRIKSIIPALEAVRRPGQQVRTMRLVKRKVDKGKGVMRPEEDEELQQMHVHQMSQISQIQDLFPDLGSGFISSLLDEYGGNTEEAIAHLLEDSLPPQLASADRKKPLSPERTRRRRSSLALKPTPQLSPRQIPVRHNIFDNDELDRLDVDMSRLHFGKQGPGKTADDLLKDRSTAPNKAAILSALSAFDADDDERDDTYDAADAGFAVNDALADDADDQKRKDANEETLWKAYQTDAKLFERDADTRRGNYRQQLKRDTGMTDEAIEGWAVMLTRNPGHMKSLEMKFNEFRGNQPTLASTAWRANASGTEESGAEEGGRGSDRGRGGHGGRGRGRGGRGGGGGGGRGGGNVAGPTGDKATENARRRKEANKGSRANHNRREGHAKKMARAGLPG